MFSPDSETAADAYDRDDPKHPTWLDDLLDRADQP